MIKLTLIITQTLFFTHIAYAQCTAPTFTEIPNNKDNLEQKSTISLNLNPSIAGIQIPSEFSTMTISPSGSLGFKSQNREAKGIIIYERADDYHLPEDINIYEFYKTLFTSPKESYCHYLSPFKLEEKKFRYRISKDGGDIYSFGSDSIQSFYILNKAKPNIIVSGELHGIEASEFEEILKSIEIKK